MRIRPLFVFLFAFVCLGTLTWAAIVPRQVPARLSIQLIEVPILNGPTRLLVKATDMQGVMIDQARLVTQASMTNMPMVTHTVTATPEGPGTYLIQMMLYMAGPWMITVSMHADGFAPLQQMIPVQVVSNLPATPTPRAATPASS